MATTKTKTSNRIKGYKNKTKKGNTLVVGRFLGNKRHYIIGVEYKNNNKPQYIVLTLKSFLDLRKMINSLYYKEILK